MFQVDFQALSALTRSKELPPQLRGVLETRSERAFHLRDFNPLVQVVTLLGVPSPAISLPFQVLQCVADARLRFGPFSKLFPISRQSLMGYVYHGFGSELGVRCG